MDKDKLKEMINTLNEMSGSEALDIIFEDINEVVNNLESDETDGESVEEMKKFYKTYYKVLKFVINRELNILKTFNDECFVLYYDEKDKEYKSMVNFDFKNPKHKLVYAYLCKDKIEDIKKLNN